MDNPRKNEINLHNRSTAVEMTEGVLSLVLKGMDFEDINANQRILVDTIIEELVGTKDRLKELQKDLKDESVNG